MGTLHEDQYTFLIICHSVLLRMRNISDKFVENIKTHILCSISPPLESHAIYEMMWKNIVEPERSQITIWCKHIVCCIPKATNTHSDYVILIAFSLQKWPHELTSVLHCTYIVQLV